MPANLSPEYRNAEARLRAAKSPDERRAALEEMLATIPKHKGTEKMQADLKRRLARLRQEVESKTVRVGHSFRVEPEGAAQLVLLGPPNSGKSSLLAALTRAEPQVGDWPFTTTRPQPGMMPFEDVQLQLIDLPPVTDEHMDPWLPDLVRGADAALLVAAASSLAAPEDVEEVRQRLAKARIPLVGALHHESDIRESPIPTMLVVTKVDAASADDVAALEDFYRDTFPVVHVAATARQGLEELKAAIWHWLQLVRVYTKVPGKPFDRTAPYVVHRGATLLELAEKIHRDLAEKLDFARVWGGPRQGLRVARDYELHDGDVVEVHAG